MASASGLEEKEEEEEEEEEEIEYQKVGQFQVFFYLLSLLLKTNVRDLRDIHS